MVVRNLFKFLLHDFCLYLQLEKLLQTGMSFPTLPSSVACCKYVGKATTYGLWNVTALAMQSSIHSFWLRAYLSVF